MLKLSQLEINGFKTFVEPVALSISDGITAIVGPNGCGKSNLSEAMTWVLGEQSAKSLRGARMEDVIFSGSAGRKPVGLAEVTLTLEADESFPASQEGRITIARRVHRSGQSLYRLNGKTVRLKEIKDLLMDTGLGIRAYSVIEQGKIGLILSGKPQERRRLIEEAAGITRYKSRKRIAEVKLEEATANLLRLDDIVSEVERSLRSLKRQASAARRFKERQTIFQDLHDRVLRGRWFLLSSRLESQTEQIAELTDTEASQTALLARDEAALVEGREALDTQASALAERHEEAAKLLAQIEGRQTFLEGARNTIKDTQERLERGNKQAEERRRATADLRGAVGELDERTTQLAESRDEAAKQVAVDDNQIAESERAVAESQRKQEADRQALLTSLSAVNRFKSQLQQQQVEIERRTLRGRYLDEEAARLSKQVAEAEGAQARIAEGLEQSEAALAETTETRHAKANALETLLERESKLGDERRAQENALSELAQRQRILEDLGRKAVEHRKTLVEALEKIGVDRPKFLADHLRTAAGWERGVDHFLGALADAVVVTGETDVLDLAQRLSAADASGSLVAWRGETGAGADAPNPTNTVVDDPAIAFSLAEALDLPAELAGALPPAYLVAEGADAARLAAAYPGIAFITRDRLWAQGGVVHVRGERAAPGVLARERELEEIRAAIPETEENITRIVAELADARSARTVVAGEVQKLEERIAELRRESAVAHARRQDAGVRLEKLQAAHQTVTTEHGELMVQLEDAGRRHRDIGTELAAAEANHVQVDEALAAAQVAVDRSREIRESLRTEGAGRRARLELLDERLQAHHQECARVRRQTDEAERQVVAWQRERDSLVARTAELEDAVKVAETELQEALEKRAVAQETVLERQRELDLQRESLREVETRVVATREARDATRQSLERARVEDARVRQDAEHLSQAFWEAFAKLLPGAEPPPAAIQSVLEPAGVEGEEGEANEVADGADPSDAVASDAESAERGAEADPSSDGDSMSAEAAAPVGQETGEAAVADDGEEGSVAQEGEGAGIVDGDEDPLSKLEVVEVEPVDAETLGDLEGEMTRAKASLERFGPVNVLAADEYDEQQERHGFLTVQRRDVAESVKSLRETIQEINDASSLRFKETFQQVNVTFGETFTKLFRGGEAEMRLLDEEDLLESGIEIMARPPGKRAQNIMLLSGGEKALTAIALLFALFQTKPSPFCILDEVDAPLDDANVLRYVDVLKEMAQDTQFLVITHNKLTMEAASTLYGVTMEEKGVSKVVAVEMDGVDPAQEVIGAA